MSNVQPVSPAARPFPPRALRPQASGHQARPGQFRRSRFIAVMKVLLPGAAVALLALVAAWPALKLEDDRFRLDFALVAPPAAEEPQMLNPRLLSIDSRQQPLTLTADMATQVSGAGQAEMFQLSEPKANIMLDDGTWWALAASDGLFQRDADLLDLKGAVSLFHDSGYEFDTESVRVFLDRRELVGEQAITGHGPFGEIQAEGFRIIDGGARILFTGKSKLTIFGGLKPPAR